MTNDCPRAKNASSSCEHEASDRSRLSKKCCSFALVVSGLVIVGTLTGTASAQEGASVQTIISPVPPLSVTVDEESLRPSPSRTMRTVPEGEPLPTVPPPKRAPVADPVIQTRGDDALGEAILPDQLSDPDVNVAGLLAIAGPPDPVGDIGPNHYVQMVNATDFQIFNTDGTSAFGPADFGALWPVGNICRSNLGDPIVVYDHLADRWLLSQFASPDFIVGFMCIAISQTPDPTAGTWFLYTFNTGFFPDYPKFGVWPDGYYMSSFEFDGVNVNLGIYAFDRANMVLGNAASGMKTTIPALGTPSVRSTRILPSDLDGPPPPAGTPNFFLRTVDDQQDLANPTDRIEVYEFAVDWATPSFSFTLADTLIPAPFQIMLCNRNGGLTRDCIPQPLTTSTVDALSNRPMMQLKYRNFGSFAAMVVNQTIDVSGSIPGVTPVNEVAGIRWYELRNSGANWTIQQQGTYAAQPAGVDTEPELLHRWMGSMAIDQYGNIALGYSIVNDDDANPVFPGIRYTGRRVGDPLGTLPEAEKTIVNGTNSQLGGFGLRWGDYSALSVDPDDDCTFWYTQHLAGIGGTGLRPTRIGSFRFASCGQPEVIADDTDFDHTWKSVSLPTAFSDPVVIAGPPTFHGSQPGVVRLRNVSSTGFQARFQEWDYLDGRHVQETLPYLVLEAGRHMMTDGSVWEAGSFPLGGTGAWLNKAFSQSFAAPPALFLTMQTFNGAQAATVRARNVTASGFEAALFEQEALMDGHLAEEVGYLAIHSADGSGEIALSGKLVPYLLQSPSVNQRFAPVLSSALKVEEEQSQDAERAHVKETLSVLALGDQIFAQDVSSAGGDTAAVRRLAPEFLGQTITPPILFGTDAGAGNLIIVDTVTGAGTVVGATGLGSVPSLAVDPTTGLMYAGQGGGNPNLHTVDRRTGTATLVGDSGLGFAALGGLDFRSDGTLFAAVNIAGDGGTGSDHLAILDKATGAAMVIGPFGTCTGVTIPSTGAGSCTIEGMEGIAFDGAGSLWGSRSARGAGTARPGLYNIDPATGAASFVAPIQDPSGTPPSGGVVSLQFIDGTLFGGTARAQGSATDGGRLVTINPGTGRFSFVGSANATGGSSLGALAVGGPVVEWGTVDGLTHDWTTVPLVKSFTNPVVVAKPVSANGSQPGVIRVRNVTGGSFELRFQEWRYLDGRHAAERVFYLVAEAGQFSVAGLEVEAGRLNSSLLLGDGFETVSFSTPFIATPAVFTAVMTANGIDPVITRVKGLAPSGFFLTMDEEEARRAGGHTIETLGWIAIERGSGTTPDGRDVAVSQTTANDQPAAAPLGLSADRLFPVMVGDVISTKGGDPVFLRYRNLTPSSAELFLQEEQSLDTETTHVLENVSVFAAE